MFKKYQSVVHIGIGYVLLLRVFPIDLRTTYSMVATNGWAKCRFRFRLFIYIGLVIGVLMIDDELKLKVGVFLSIT